MKDSTLKWYEWRLAGLLPERSRLLLLQACLEEEHVARGAWNDFCAIEGQPKIFFERADGALRGLLPFIESGLARNGIDPGQDFRTYLRVAVVREELRDRIYRDVFSGVMTCIGTRLRPPVVLRGLALADDCYPIASRRHNHSIDLLVREEDLESAFRLLVEAGFEPGKASLRHESQRSCVHRSGLPVMLHSRLFSLPHLVEPTEAIRSRARVTELAGVRAAVPDPADHLLHVCGRTAYSAGRNNLRWLCDTVLLIRRYPRLDWGAVVCNAAYGGVALPMAVLLNGIRGGFTVPIPESVVPQLRNRHGLDRFRVRQTIQAMALECPLSPVSRGSAPCAAPAAAFRLALFRLLPSRAYLRWKYEVDGFAATSWRYLHRPLRYLSRVLRDATRQAA